MFRLGVIILVLVGFVSILSRNDSEQALPESQNTHEQNWIDRQIRREKARWILPQNELRIVKLCSGRLDEDFGYSEPMPKMIYFFNAKEGIPRIIASRLRDRGAYRSFEVSSLRINDLNFELSEQEGIRAEHGSLDELASLDQIYHSRRLDRLFEEALELCTVDILDPRQKEIEMENLREMLEETATAFIAYDYPTRSNDAQLEVVYELNGLLLRTKIKPHNFL